MNPMVLCYNVQPEKLGRIRVLALRLGIRLHAAAPEEFALPVGALAGALPMPRERPETAEPFSDEMMLMAHFRPGMLDAFLNGFRQSRIPSVKLKAMLTGTNATWNAAELHAAILEEHEQMEAFRSPKKKG